MFSVLDNARKTMKEKSITERCALSGNYGDIPRVLRRKKSQVRGIIKYYDKRHIVIEPPKEKHENRCKVCNRHRHLSDFCTKFKRYGYASKNIVGCQHFRREIM